MAGIMKKLCAMFSALGTLLANRIVSPGEEVWLVS
jgi:hypothetical protein